MDRGGLYQYKKTRKSGEAAAKGKREKDAAERKAFHSRRRGSLTQPDLRVGKTLGKRGSVFHGKKEKAIDLQRLRNLKSKEQETDRAN